MAEIKLHIGTRKHLRGTVTHVYNTMNTYGSLDNVQVEMAKTKLTQLRVDLTGVDAKINALQFQEDGSEERLNTELKTCSDYQDRINEAFHRLTLAAPANVVQTDQARSLLKRPQAPLPKFSSEPGENFEIFIRNFEDTTGKFEYTDYDKFILLKNQITGKALLLIDSLEPKRQTYNEAKSC